MNNCITLELLMIIKNRRSIYSLIQKGYSPSQISIFLNELEECNFIEFKENELVVSSNGNNYLEKTYKEKKLDGVHRWISPQEYFRTQSCDKYDIIFPKKNKFLR